jgi:hypothetical protein
VTARAAADVGAPCVAPTWPDFITNEDGLWWVRLDLEPIAKRAILRMECGFALDTAEYYEFSRIGRCVMVRDHDLYEEGGLQVADPRAEHEHDEAAVYVAYEVWA